MAENAVPQGFAKAQFSPGFLDHGGPYFLKEGGLQEGGAGPKIVGLRIESHHINYQEAAHGGVVSTFADVALSHAVYDAERPRLAPSTITLQVNYLKPAMLGDWLEAHVRIDRLGGRTAYTSGQITRDGEPIATMSGVFAFKRP